MRSRFVRPETTTLQLSGGDWLIVKQRLTSGEQRAAYARMWIAGADGSRKVDPLGTGLAQITAYLLDWSLVGLDEKPWVIRDQPIDVVVSALNALDMESFVEIREAIETHEAAILAVREEEKKRIQIGDPSSEAISPSPSDVDGQSTKLETLM